MGPRSSIRVRKNTKGKKKKGRGWKVVPRNRVKEKGKMDIAGE